MKSANNYCAINAHQGSRGMHFGRGGQAGFSLIELMIAITLSLIITAALITLFLNMNRANSEMAKTNMQIENGRFAMQLLQADIEHGGYWGGHIPQFDDLTFTAIPTDTATAVPNPCLAYTAPWTATDIRNFIAIPVQVYGNTPPAGTGCLTNLATNKQASTDALVVRYAETCVAGSGGNCEADIVGGLYFQSSRCELENASPYILSTADFTRYQRNCVGTGNPQTLPITAGTIAAKRKFVSRIFYIRDYAMTVGDGIPTLMGSKFNGVAHQAAVPLIEGIEGFRVELGVDNLSDTGAAVNSAAAVTWANPDNLTSPTNRGDGVPDGAFVRCTDAAPCTDAQLSNVVAVKLYVLARAASVSAGYRDTKTYALGTAPLLGPFNDGFKRHVFSTTVRLNNVSGRRETPP